MIINFQRLSEAKKGKTNQQLLEQRPYREMTEEEIVQYVVQQRFDVNSLGGGLFQLTRTIADLEGNSRGSLISYEFNSQTEEMKLLDLVGSDGRRFSRFNPSRNGQTLSLLYERGSDSHGLIEIKRNN